MQIEVGGGMRTLEHIEQVLAQGVDRVILGTVAITQRELVKQAVERWRERIAVGLDARDGWVAVAGWIETSQVRAERWPRNWLRWVCSVSSIPISLAMAR